MEEIFAHVDKWGTKLIILAKGGQTGIKTSEGELILLSHEETAELNEALTEHLNKTTD